MLIICDMKRIKMLVAMTLSLLFAVTAEAQVYDVKIDSPQKFAVSVPDGNYKVTLTIGSKKKAAQTMVRAENRRLYVENLNTKKREQKTVSFVVNKRTPKIDDKLSVKIKPREAGYNTWNDSLDLEFAGNPAVSRIVIEPDTMAQTVYLCGNSTVTDQPSEPWASWGQMFTRWFDDGVCISNHAESGLTARTFIAGNRLEQICSRLRKGDVVICEFGHNDEKEKRPGDGAWYHYVYNLKIFVDRAREKGATIVFCTPTQRRFFESDGKTIQNTHGDFPAAMKCVAERENVPVIDLNAMTKTFFETLGNEGSKSALVHYPANTFPGQDKAFADNTHFNPYGAYEVSKMVVMGLLKIVADAKDNDAVKDLSRLTSHLVSDWKNFDCQSPDDFGLLKWHNAPSCDLAKPDGN